MLKRFVSDFTSLIPQLQLWQAGISWSRFVLFTWHYGWNSLSTSLLTQELSWALAYWMGRPLGFWILAWVSILLVFTRYIYMVFLFVVYGSVARFFSLTSDNPILQFRLLTSSKTVVCEPFQSWICNIDDEAGNHPLYSSFRDYFLQEDVQVSFFFFFPPCLIWANVFNFLLLQNIMLCFLKIKSSVTKMHIVNISCASWKECILFSAITCLKSLHI